MNDVEIQGVNALQSLGWEIKPSEPVVQERAFDCWETDDVPGGFAHAKRAAWGKDVHFVSKRDEFPAEGFDRDRDAVGLREVAVGENSYLHIPYCIAKAV